MLTTEQRRRTIQAMTETCGLLEKELSYSEQFQRPERVAEYKDHIVKLEEMLQAKS